MIRSARIPHILSRICTDHVIQTAVLVTSDGELLGSTSTTFVSPDGSTRESVEHLGTLIADIAVDYQRLGNEYAALDGTPPTQKKSHMQCLLLELEQGLVGVSGCVGVDCLVIAIAAPNAPLGTITARLQAITEFVQEALSPLTETVYR
jgi:hypothetical protein